VAAGAGDRTCPMPRPRPAGRHDSRKNPTSLPEPPGSRETFHSNDFHCFYIIT
jgi:hypothetical protein